MPTVNICYVRGAVREADLKLLDERLPGIVAASFDTKVDNVIVLPMQEWGMEKEKKQKVILFIDVLIKTKHYREVTLESSNTKMSDMVLQLLAEATYLSGRTGIRTILAPIAYCRV